MPEHATDESNVESEQQPATPAAEPDGRAPRRAAPKRDLVRAFFRPSRGQLVVGIALFVTAFIVVLTLRSQSTQPEFSNARQADLIQLLDNVSAETRRMEDEVRELELARTELISGANRDEAARQEATRRLEHAQILAGTVPAIGSGVRIQIDDPEEKVTPELLLDAVQELRDAGAEVIEFNDSVRLVMSSFFALDEDGRVTADGTVLSAPYVIDAIGDPATLEAGARFRGGLVSEVEGERVGGTVTIEQGESVTIDTIVTPRSYEFARPK